MPGLSYPSALRNRGPIADLLSRVLPDEGLVLEVASGSGEHSLLFAKRFGHLTWQPSDTDPRALQSIRAWAAESSLGNLRPPLDLDVLEPWPLDAAAAIVCINMVHISPWQCSQALLRGAADRLPPGGLLYLYGPYNVDGHFTAPSNQSFDASLRAKDPRWGLRDVGQVETEAGLNGLALEETVEMPANNLSLIFRRA